VYYSAFSPIQTPSQHLPLAAPPLAREHRLYQADWLLRYYGFRAEELFDQRSSGRLDLEVDPKLTWALANRERFPVNVNTAAREMLLRIPGVGVRNVKRILAMRRHQQIRFDHLAVLRCEMEKVAPFVITADYHPPRELQSDALRARLRKAPAQLALF